ncbi:pre-mRNA-splicing factor ATP-dependent RNA helicase PRP43 [Apiospora saccharicola]|uniref:Pre-mRNA-splicing factor ATP-dependent RNA helicase PRP43 n=1 Tax=Apiospora saccharicola TaxID=335842 RepID=A0ABR1U3Z5_9PEZI
MSSLSDKLKSSFAAQSNLPMMQNKDAIIDSIRNNKVTILTSETGSGKTTLTPLFCLEDALNNEDAGMIMCTQPRKLAATSVAKQVARQIGVKVGEEVGYAVRFDKKMTGNTRVLYTTDGHLLQQMTNDSNLKPCSYILVDEVHERSVPTELLIAMLKIVVDRRNDLKLVIMSATLNAGKLSAFFNDAPIVTLTGRQFQVRIAYMSEPVLNVTMTVIATVLHIHKTKPGGDILVFMRGADEIEACPEAERLTALPLYSALQGAEDEVFSSSTDRKEAYDKIMLAYATPKIMGSNLNEPVLLMMKAGFTDILNVYMVDKFAPEALLRSIDELLSM